jgi:menaquinol-cytochrome c reductase iron-sulfur subunit
MHDPTAPPPASAARRLFLKWATAVSAGVSAGLVGIPAARAFFTPAGRRPAPERWVELGPAASFRLHTPTKVDFTERTQDGWVESQATRSVWVYTTDGEAFTVYSGRCPHLGCSFVFAAEPGPFHSEPNVFHCPCHNGVFAAADGAVLRGPPPRALDRLDIRLEDGTLYAKHQDFRVGVPQRVAI